MHTSLEREPNPTPAGQLANSSSATAAASEAWHLTPIHHLMKYAYG